MNEKPKRIQLSRKKGWRMPDNTIKVDRSTKWGNWYHVGRDGNVQQCVDKYKKRVLGNVWSWPTIKDIQTELAGKNIGCWCNIGEPCHGDWLLEIANPKADQ